MVNIAEVKKFGAYEMNRQIRHALRELPPGKSPGNEDIIPELTKKNYSLLDHRCQTSKNAIKYRTELEKEIFRYNRKNVVREVGIIVQCPADCPESQKEDFFRETYKYICSTLPMGERCVVVAQIHVDERMKNPYTGEMISKDHLHVLFVPAVKDTKHEGYAYRLCADQLVKKKFLYGLHNGLQKHLDNAGIKATVRQKKNGDGKSIPLTVAQLKELTNKAGITLDHSLTADELSKIISSNVLNKKQAAAFQQKLALKEAKIEALSAELYQASAIEKENAILRQRVSDLEREVKAKSGELSKSRIHEQELQKKIDHLESKNIAAERQRTEHTWGQESGWGNTSGWGSRNTSKDISKEEEKLW